LKGEKTRRTENFLLEGEGTGEKVGKGSSEEKKKKQEVFFCRKGRKNLDGGKERSESPKVQQVWHLGGVDQVTDSKGRRTTSIYQECPVYVRGKSVKKEYAEKKSGDDG